ncbi:MAG TPA: metal-dependent hydrolase [Saprospiraceae bacterium]|nr:metal-dependent hydrolase [Saprospiraceae bacterium]
MDSLTQMILGAAMGELAAGKKMGNRAMIWGAIAGTIPDLDVIVGNFMSPIDALANHRGLSHSILFAVVFSFFMAVFCKWLYQQKFSSGKAFRWLSYIIGILFFALLTTFFVFFTYILAGMILAVFLGVLLCYWLIKSGIWSYKNYVIHEVRTKEEISLSRWYLLFFLAIFTHPLLDCCTVYGTQLFYPFSDVRVAWNIIAIFDPFYTYPFLLCLLIAAHLTRQDTWRTRINNIGIIYSTSYMLACTLHKLHINSIVEKTIELSDIHVKRYMTNPSLMSNFLWSTTIETDSFYYQGLYSDFDKERIFKLQEIPKNHELIAPYETDKTIEILKWFSADYYAVLVRKDGLLQLNDMRYGTFNGGSANDEDNYIFKFVLEEEEGVIHFDPSKSGPPARSNPKEMMDQLISRTKGI